MGLWDDIVDGAESLFGGSKKPKKPELSEAQIEGMARQDIEVQRATDDLIMARMAVDKAKKAKGEAEKAAESKRLDSYISENQRAIEASRKADGAYESYRAGEGKDAKQEQALYQQREQAFSQKLKLENRQRWMEEHPIESFIPHYQIYKQDIEERQQQANEMEARLTHVLNAAKARVRAQAQAQAS